MKQFLFLLAVGLAGASAAQAQVGVRLGGSVARFRTGEGQVVHSSSSAQAGFQVGVTYQVPLTDRLALVPEVQYSHERLKLEQTSFAILDASFQNYTQLAMHYLNVPVLVRATFGPVYVEAGPQASLLLGGRQTGTSYVSSWYSSSMPRAYEIDQAITQDNRRFDVGPCLGLGVKLPAGLGANVRLYQGLVAVNDQRASAEGSYRRQSLQAALTYALPTR